MGGPLFGLQVYQENLLKKNQTLKISPLGNLGYDWGWEQLPWDLQEGAWANCLVREFIKRLYIVVKRALRRNQTEEKRIKKNTPFGKFGTLIGDK